MKPINEKESNLIDLIVCKIAHPNTFLSPAKLFLALFLFFSLSFSSAVQAAVISITNQQVPAKAKPVVKKGKSKKSTKGRKSNVSKKDTLSDIDPANTSSPLYQKSNNNK